MELERLCLLVSAFTPMLVLVVNQVTDYLAERRAKGGWESILRAIDVYDRWIHIGSDRALAGLRAHVDRLIEGQTLPRYGFTVPFKLFAALSLAVNAFIAYTNVRAGNTTLVIEAASSSVMIAAMMVLASRRMQKLKRAADNQIREDLEEVDAAMLHLLDFYGGEARLSGLVNHLEEEDDIDRRLAHSIAQEDALIQRVLFRALKRMRNDGRISSSGVDESGGQSPDGQ